MNKKDLRKQMLERLQVIDKTDRSEIEKQMQEHLFASDLWKEASIIGVTISGGGEWETHAIIERGWEEGKTVCVPKTLPETKGMAFYSINDFSQTKKGFYNLVEPLPEKAKKIKKEAIDLLIVPGLIYNRYGYRIGFGGGYYDRFLSDFRNTTVSMLHSSQLIDDIPVKPHDIPVNYLLTEEGIFESRHG